MADSLVDDLVDEKNNGKRYSLNEYETAYVTELGELLKYHVFQNQIVINFLRYVLLTRLGYTKVHDKHHLQIDIDMNKKPFDILVKEVPSFEK